MHNSMLSHTSNQSHMTADSLGLPDSWTLHSAIYASNPSFLDALEEAAHSRVSIGTFMGFRTETLGSLDGDEDHRVSKRDLIMSYNNSCWVKSVSKVISYSCLF